MNEELKQYGLHVEYSEADDREPIDFEIRDSRGELYATVWGSSPRDDVQIDCEHDIVEYEDDETQGECAICGAVCDWHYEDDGDGNSVRVPHDWHMPKKIYGIVGRELERLQERW